MTKPQYLAMSNASPERQRRRLEAMKPDDTSGCWEWNGTRTWGGYGVMRTGPQSKDYVHRISYRLNRGEIPDGFQIDHLCRTRNCFNPDHLEAVTGLENWLRGESKSAVVRRTNMCHKGLHELVGDNVMGSTGRRRCRPCFRAWRSARASAPMQT